MELITLGLSHHDATVEQREAYALTPDGVRRAVETVGRVGEAVVLSTCNRTEFYAVADDADTVRRAVAELVPRAAQDERLQARTGRAAALHLFRVASGLDSLMVGETEIFGQVKDAYESAVDSGRVGKWLHRMFQAAFRAGKAVRSGTAITRGAISVGAAAVDLAAQIFGDLASCRVLLIGAGDTAEKTLRALMLRGVADVVVCNRTHAHAEELAASLGGRAEAFDRWPEVFRGAHIVVSATAAPGYVIPLREALPLLSQRGGGELFLIDLAMPRDIAPELALEDDVYLYNVDDLQLVADRNLESRRAAMAEAEALVDRHVDDFMRWLDAQRRQGGGTLRVKQA